MMSIKIPLNGALGVDAHDAANVSDDVFCKPILPKDKTHLTFLMYLFLRYGLMA